MRLSFKLLAKLSCYEAKLQASDEANLLAKLACYEAKLQASGEASHLAKLACCEGKLQVSGEAGLLRGEAGLLRGEADLLAKLACCEALCGTNTPVMESCHVRNVSDTPVVCIFKNLPRIYMSCPFQC